MMSEDASVPTEVQRAVKSATPRPLIVAWGVGGVMLLFGQAIFRLGQRAVEPLEAGGLSTLDLGFYALSLAFMGYAEGYRAFQLKYAPRVVKRALHLAAHPSPGYVLLAPFYCMGLIHASRRRLISSWAVLLGIVGLVLVVRLLAQPWRGMVDAGVVLGLTWGVVALLVWAIRGISGTPVPGEPDLP